MKANPEIKALLQDLRAALHSYREMRKLLIRTAGGTALAFLIYKPVGLLALPLFALALWYFFRSREHLRGFRGMPCLDCDTERSHVLTFEPWVCGSCSKTNSDKERTWADACECNATPHSFICPACREPIIFDDYAFERSPDKSAWLPGYPPLLEKEEEKPIFAPRPIDEELR